MRLITITYILFFYHLSIYSQVVFESIDKDIYSYLERLGNKGVIQIDDLFRPFSRYYIGEKLNEAREKIRHLTELEREELEFYEKEYYWEQNGFGSLNGNKYLSYFETGKSGRYHIFSYNDDTFKFNAVPQLGFKQTFIDKDKNFLSEMGLDLYGYLLNNIGFSLEIKTNNIRGEAIDITREFTPQTGFLPDVRDRGRDVGYSDVNASISVDWRWGSASISKDYMQYGYAKFGNLILSNKAPSFPHIKLQLNPVDWFKFYFFHAWLTSDVIDSANLAAYKRDIYIDKFFAWHAISVTPFRGFDISLGESVIYGDKLEIAYLMPVMFYFFADDFISSRRGKPGDANQQIFLTLSSRNNIKNTHLYTTLFIDEMTIGGINGSIFINNSYGGATKRRERTQLGYTVGASITDLPFDNLNLNLEYTRINPFVYGHHDPAQTYRNSSYLMGHWMGHNADLFYSSINYRIFRGLQSTFWGAYIRKGSDDYSEQYASTQPPFLFGLRNTYKYFGIDVNYEFLHQLKIEAKFKSTAISSEQDDNSTKEKNFSEISLRLSYGF